jgi:hypothetical protein
MTQMVKSVVGGLGGGGLSGLSQSSSATQSLQNQLQTNATPGSPQFQAVQNQITQTQQDAMNQAAAANTTGNTTATAPSLTLVGPSNGGPDGSDANNPMVWTLGTPWVDPGVAAADTADGDLHSKVVIGGDTVDVNIPGTYTITYNVTNSQGIPASTVTRTVSVVAPTTTP